MGIDLIGSSCRKFVCGYFKPEDFLVVIFSNRLKGEKSDFSLCMPVKIQSADLKSKSSSKLNFVGIFMVFAVVQIFV